MFGLLSTVLLLAKAAESIHVMHSLQENELVGVLENSFMKLGIPVNEGMFF